MIQWIKELICEWFGHDWDVDPKTNEVVCARCGFNGDGETYAGHFDLPLASFG